MTKSEIEELIVHLQGELPKFVFDERPGIFCEVKTLIDMLRNYHVEKDKTCWPNYQAMYEQCAAELEAARAKIESIKFDMHHLSIENAHYAGAVAAMETIFGRKFEPKK